MSEAMASAGPLPTPQTESKSKTPLFIGIALAALALIAAIMMLGGPKTGGLVISVAGPGGTAVKGVSVSVDGEQVCQDSTCKVKDLEVGSYVVKATAEGYAEMAGKAYEVEAGEQKAINIELVAEAGGTGLKVSSKAQGLTLYVDGKKIGSLPQELDDIEPGDHKIKLDGSEFIEEFEESVTVKKGDTLEFEPKLKLKKGQVAIQLDDSAKGAKVALVVNGKRRSLASTIKKAKSDTVKIDLPVDDKTYKLTATRKGFEDFEKDLTFSVEAPVSNITLKLTKEGEEEEEEEEEAEEEEETSAAPAPAPRPRPVGGARPAARPAPAPKPAASGAGKLNINSIPVSNVLLDGRPLGSTPKVGVSVSAGPHTVVFIHPQHGRKVRQVNVSGGGVATAAVRFP